MVTERDVQRDFFLTPSDVGSSLGESLVNNFSKLNDQVSFSHLNLNPSKAVQDPAFLRSLSHLFTCVKQCHQLSVPLITSTLLGPFFSIQLFAGTYHVIETHNDPIFYPLLTSPPDNILKLTSHFQEVGLDSSDAIPWIVYVLTSIQRFKEEFGREVQRGDYMEVERILSEITQSFSVNESVVEAQSNLFQIFKTLEIPSTVQECFDLISSSKVSVADEFWTLMTCVYKFYQMFNRLPHNGYVPDMNSDSKSFLIIRDSFKFLYSEDLACLQELYSILVRENPKTVTLAPTELNTKFSKLCKNLWNLHLSSYPTSFFDPDSLNVSDIISSLEDTTSSSCSNILAVFVCCSRFFDAHARLPASDDDKKAFGLLLSHLDSEWGMKGKLRSELTEDLFEEVVRAQDAQLHCLSSISGSICAQEIIKLVTNQFIPLDNTFVWNGIKGFGGTLKL
ncbi:hypothetical protein GEMRC1_008747 [Eukaryota sp. GEM-RC1]